MASQCRALKVKATANRSELQHDGVEGVSEVGLFPRIGGGAGRSVVWSRHGRRCTGIDV
jgi:hypothetical protein